MNVCICCHDQLLRHLDRSRVYWFCPSCHREMPNIDMLSRPSRIEIQRIKPNRFSLVSTIK